MKISWKKVRVFSATTCMFSFYSFVSFAGFSPYVAMCIVGIMAGILAVIS